MLKNYNYLDYVLKDNKISFNVFKGFLSSLLLDILYLHSRLLLHL